MSVRPAVDALTPKAMVVLQDRPVVGFTNWLADALRVCGETGRGLQLLTPPESRITLPMRLVLTSVNSRWVVRADGGYYDGLLGVPLLWDGAEFAPVPGARMHVPTFLRPMPEPIGAQLALTLRVRRPPDEPPGGVIEKLFRELTGGPPGGWGTAEPATGRWRRDDIAAFLRDGAPRTAWLIVIGAADAVAARAAVGTLLVAHTDTYAEEAVTLVFGYETPDRAPAGELAGELAGIVGRIAAEHVFVSLFAQLGPGRADLTTGPYRMGAPGPIGMAIGGGPPAPPGIPATPIGGEQYPAVWYALGDGLHQEDWQRYEQLTRHLQAHPPAGTA